MTDEIELDGKEVAEHELSRRRTLQVGMGLVTGGAAGLFTAGIAQGSAVRYPATGGKLTLSAVARSYLFPEFPPTVCVGGYIFFPGGVGPTFPIFCDERDIVLLSPARGFSEQSVKEPGSAFATKVAQLAGVSVREAEHALARAAGVDPRALHKMTTRDLGRKIAYNTLPKVGGKFVNPAPDETIGSYVPKLAKIIDANPQAAFKDFAQMTGLSHGEVGRLRLTELGDHLNVLGLQPDQSVAKTGGGTPWCVSYNGKIIRCGVGPEWLDGAVWGGVIGGAIGGGLGAAIGAAIGAIIDWLF